MVVVAAVLAVYPGEVVANCAVDVHTAGIEIATGEPLVDVNIHSVGKPAAVNLAARNVAAKFASESAVAATGATTAVVARAVKTAAVKIAAATNDAATNAAGKNGAATTDAAMTGAAMADAAMADAAMADAAMAAWSICARTIFGKTAVEILVAGKSHVVDAVVIPGKWVELRAALGTFAAMIGDSQPHHLPLQNRARRSHWGPGVLREDRRHRMAQLSHVVVAQYPCTRQAT